MTSRNAFLIFYFRDLLKFGAAKILQIIHMYMCTGVGQLRTNGRLNGTKHAQDMQTATTP